MSLESMLAQEMFTIFESCIREYHKTDSTDTPLSNPHSEGSLEGLLFHKNWIDTVQWHLEDIIRRPDLPDSNLVVVKRRIDGSNQERTDMVEQIDDLMVERFGNVNVEADARLNTETPAWVIDRLSILALKIYHMQEQTARNDASSEHIQTCKEKLRILLEQKSDLCNSLDEFLEDIAAGKKRMKVYRQMKMYNDKTLNPQLYKDTSEK